MVLSHSDKWKILLICLAWMLCVTAVVQPAEAKSVDELYRQARGEYQKLAAAAPSRFNRKSWERCIKRLEGVIEADKSKKVTDKATYLIGQSYHYLYDQQGRRKDYLNALKNYRTLVNGHPKSPLADDAQYLSGMLHLKDDKHQAYFDFFKVGVLFPDGDMAPKAREMTVKLEQELHPQPSPKTIDKGRAGEAPVPAPGPGSTTPPRAAAGKQPAAPEGLSYLNEIQHWSAESYTRVALYFSAPVEFEEHTLEPDPKKDLPDRIYFDLKQCVVSPDMEHRISIMDGFLRRVRVGQYLPKQARVVLDIESIDSYKVFSLADPFRIVIDIRGQRPAKMQVPRRDQPPSQGGRISLARQLGLGVNRIVLDPGHGGKDPGAIGPSGVLEKDIVLAIAKRLKKLIEANTSCEVILTRTRDQFLTLEERTAIANTKKADLFISIHTNAHQNSRIGGFITYSLNFSTDEESARVAALENATSTKRVSDLEAILHDLMLNTKISESTRFARVVQRHTVRGMKADYRDLRDLGVKQAPFYVLLGAEMPSILIETSFISNPREEKRLKSRKYQEGLAKGIATGVQAYIQSMKQVSQLGAQ